MNIMKNYAKQRENCTTKKSLFYLSPTRSLLSQKMNNKWILCYYLNAFSFFHTFFLLVFAPLRLPLILWRRKIYLESGGENSREIPGILNLNSQWPLILKVDLLSKEQLSCIKRDNEILGGWKFYGAIILCFDLEEKRAKLSFLNRNSNLNSPIFCIEIFFPQHFSLSILWRKFNKLVVAGREKFLSLVRVLLFSISCNDVPRNESKKRGKTRK